MKIKGTLIKYLLLSLLLFTQLFAYEKNKLMTVYGYVSEKENHYILNAYYINGKTVKDTPFQLLFDSDEINITIPTKQYSQYPKHSKLKGIILEGKSKNKEYLTPNIFKVNSVEKINSKIKAVSYLNKYGKVKLMVTSLMAGKYEAKAKKIDIAYISNIKMKADNKVLYNVNVSPCLTDNPVMKFSYKGIKPLSLTLEYTDNDGKIRTNSKKVNHRNTAQEIPRYLELSPNTNSYPNQVKSIKKLFGDITLIEDGIQLTAPKVAENSGNVPITIRSNIKFKSIALFLKIGNPRSTYASSTGCVEGDGFSLVSQWFSTPYSLVDFDLRLKMRDRGEVLVVLEAENGKFYTIKKEVKVPLGGALGY